MIKITARKLFWHIVYASLSYGYQKKACNCRNLLTIYEVFHP